MNKKKYFVESKLAIYFIGKVISAFIMLLSIPLYIKWFGQIQYGHYILAYTTFLVFLSGSLGWLNHALIKHYSLFKNNNRFKLKVETIVFRTSVLSSVLLCVLLYITKQLSISTIPIVFFGFIAGCFYLNELVFTQVKYNAFSFIISEFIRISVCLLIVFLLFRLTEFSSEKILFAGISLSYVLGYLYQTKLKLPSFNVVKGNHLDIKMLKKFLTYGLPIGVWMALTPSSNTLDRYVLSSYMGAAALTQYTAIYDIVFKIFTQLVTPIATIIQPILMQNYNDKNEVEYVRIRNKAAMYLLILFVPTILAFSLFDDFIIVDYLGFEEEHVINKLKKIVIPIALSSLIWQIAILLQRKIEASGKSYLVTIAMIFVVLTSAALSMFFLSKFDYSILGYISLFSSIIYLSTICFLIKRNEV